MFFTIVTDNAKNCQAVGKGIEQMSRCVCCTLNPIFNDVANALAWLRDTDKADKIL